MHLIVTEKNIAARRIAAILAPKNPKKERVNGVDTYQYEIGTGEDKQETVVIGLSGHIVGIDFPSFNRVNLSVWGIFVLIPTALLNARYLTAR